jgi:hypothetical protein
MQFAERRLHTYNLMGSQNYCIFLKVVLYIFLSADPGAALPSRASAIGIP